MSEPLVIPDDTEGQARFLLQSILRTSVLELYTHAGDTITCTTSYEIAGAPEAFNTQELFYVYDLNRNEWITLRYEEVDSMDIVSTTKDGPWNIQP